MGEPWGGQSRQPSGVGKEELWGKMVGGPWHCAKGSYTEPGFFFQFSRIDVPVGKGRLLPSEGERQKKSCHVDWERGF